MRNRRRQLNVPHSLPADLGLDDLNTTFFTDDATVLHPFVFAAVAFVILGRTENLGTEQPIPLGFEGSVINGFRFFNLTMGPLPDLVRGSQGDFYARIASGVCRL